MNNNQFKNNIIISGVKMKENFKNKTIVGKTLGIDV